MGTRESTALIPVCMGSLTDCLGMMPGAFSPTQNFHTNWDIHNSSCPLHDISFLDKLVVTEDDNTNIVRLQIEGHALEAGAEFHHLLCLDVLESIDTSNTVSNGEDTASLLKIDSGSSSKNSILQDGGNLSGGSLSSIELAVSRELASCHSKSGHLLGHLSCLGSLTGKSRGHSSGDLSHFSDECEAVTEDVGTVEAVSRLVRRWRCRNRSTCRRPRTCHPSVSGKTRILWLTATSIHRRTARTESHGLRRPLPMQLPSLRKVLPSRS